MPGNGRAVHVKQFQREEMICIRLNFDLFALQFNDLTQNYEI